MARSAPGRAPLWRCDRGTERNPPDRSLAPVVRSAQVSAVSYQREAIVKPTTMKPGQQIVCNGRVMTFLRRIKAYCGRPAENWFQCDDYRGLYGPNDDGRCTMSDYRVVQQVQPLSADSRKLRAAI